MNEENHRPTKDKPHREELGIFSYYEGGTKKFLVRMQREGHDWRKFGFSTITKARMWRDSRKGRAAERRQFPEQELAERHRADAHAETQTPLLSEYATETWMVACKAKRLKHSTMLRYESILRTHLIPAFDGLRLHMIDRAHLRRLVATMADAGAAAKTVHNVVRVLSAIFTLAMEDELVSHQPAGHPSKLMKIRKRGDALPVFTFEEKQVILATAKELLPHYYPFILLLFRTGLREGEAVAL